MDVSHATDIAGKGVFLEAGPRRNDFPKANASELLALCILARSQRRAGRRQEPTQTQGGAECCRPQVLWGSSSAPQGSPGSHRTDSRDSCSPAPAPWQSREQRDGMRQAYFSPSTQAPILQMTHFLHLLPITLQLVQTRCDKAVTRLLRRTAGTSSCQNKERVRGSKREGWGRGGWENPAPTSSAPPPAPEGSDAGEQPLGFVPLRLQEPIRGSAGWGGGGGGGWGSGPRANTRGDSQDRQDRSGDAEPGAACAGGLVLPPAGEIGQLPRAMGEPETRCLPLGCSGFCFPREFRGKTPQGFPPPTGTPPAEGKAQRKTAGPTLRIFLEDGRDGSRVPTESRSAVGSSQLTPARAGSGATPAPAAARRSQPGRILHGIQSWSSSQWDTAEKDKRNDSKNKIKTAQCPIPLKTEAASKTRSSAKMGAEAEAAGTWENLTMQLILALT